MNSEHFVNDHPVCVRYHPYITLYLPKKLKGHFSNDLSAM